MLALYFLFASLSLGTCAFLFIHFRWRNADAVAEATLFETRFEPPFLRPIVTRFDGSNLKVDAPVVLARLVNKILVLDVSSNSGARAEGFELAITEFNMEYLQADKYAHHEGEGYLLVGPRGESTDRLLQRAGQLHALDLPKQGGTHVQAYAIQSIVTDPGDFSVEITALTPAGEEILIRYDYAQASLHAHMSAAAFCRKANYQPLQVEMKAA